MNEMHCLNRTSTMRADAPITLRVAPRHGRDDVRIDSVVPLALGVLSALVEADMGIASPEICELVERIHRWMKGNGARISMNKSFAALRKRSPHKLRSMLLWLERRDIEFHFRRHGVREVHTILREGMARENRGGSGQHRVRRCSLSATIACASNRYGDQ